MSLQSPSKSCQGPVQIIRVAGDRQIRIICIADPDLLCKKNNVFMTYCIRKNLLYCTAVNNKTFTLKVHLKCNIICIFVLQNAKTGSRLTILLINAHILLKKCTCLQWNPQNHYFYIFKNLFVIPNKIKIFISFTLKVSHNFI